MPKLNTYPLKGQLTAATQLLGIIPGAGTEFETVRVSQPALVTLIQQYAGQPGTDGKEIELRKGSTSIEWRYVGDTTWIALVALDDLKGNNGNPGDPVQLQKSATAIQWKYATSLVWTDLVPLTDLRGTNGTNGRTMWPVSGTPSSALGVDGDFANDVSGSVMYGPKANNNWGAGVSYKGLKGDTGTGLKNRGSWVTGTTYQPGDYVFSTGSATTSSMWILNGDVPYVSNTLPKDDLAKWVEFVAPAGENGVNGKSVELRKTSTALEWRREGDADWLVLVTLNDIKGEPGTNGTNGNKWLSSTGAPVSGVGANGDYYWNTATGDVYGPKASGAWGSIVATLKGNPGTNGVGVVAGGAIGQVLRKKSATDFDTEWGDSLGGNTDNVPEGATNKYWTLARTLGSVLTGLVTSTTGNIVAADTLLVALGKLQNSITANATALANKAAKGVNSDITSLTGIVSNFVAGATGVILGSAAVPWARLYLGTLSMSGAVNHAPQVTVASAATVQLGAVAANSVIITGTTDIGSMGDFAAGTVRMVRFTGILNLYNSTALVLPGSVNMATRAGDTATFESTADSWRMTQFQRADGSLTMISGLNMAPQATIASAGNLNLQNVPANTIRVTGAEYIGGIGDLPAGSQRRLVFVNTASLAASDALVLPGAANITASPGDVADLEYFGAGVWRLTNYFKANGRPLVGGSAAWGSITGTLSAQTDLQTALDSKIASSLIDFVFIYPNGGSPASPANISLNTRLINANPFPGFSVICEVECLVSGVWETPGWVSSSTQSPNSIGVRSSQRRGGSSDEIVTQSGSIANITGGAYTGGSYSGAYTTAALPVRVKVWKVKS